MRYRLNSEDVRRHLHGPSMKPLRSLKEMAEEFGVTVQKLSREISLDEKSPKQQIRTYSASSKNSWYEPVAMRKWWRSVTNK